METFEGYGFSMRCTDGNLFLEIKNLIEQACNSLKNNLRKQGMSDTEMIITQYVPGSSFHLCLYNSQESEVLFALISQDEILDNVCDNLFNEAKYIAALNLLKSKAENYPDYYKNNKDYPKDKRIFDRALVYFVDKINSLEQKGER